MKRLSSARYLKAEKSRLYVNGLVLRDPVLADGDYKGPIVMMGSARDLERRCRDGGFFFNAPK